MSDLFKCKFSSLERALRNSVRCMQFEFGFSALLLSPVTGSIMAFWRSLQAEHMVLNHKVRKVCNSGSFILLTCCIT